MKRYHRCEQNGNPGDVLINQVKSAFFERLKRKPNWTRDEIKQEFELATSEYKIAVMQLAKIFTGL